MKYVNERGYALFIAVMICAVVSLLGLGLLSVTANSSKTTVNERFDQSLYYIAESAINLEKSKIYDAIDTIYLKSEHHINQLTFEEQQQLLMTYGSFENYFYANVHSQFCTEYNNFITNNSECVVLPNQTYSFENEYNYFTKQFNEQPFAKTKITGRCEYISEYTCSFDIQSASYFENNPTNTRSLQQKLLVELGSNAVSHSDNSKNGSSNLLIDNISVITNGNIIMTGSSHIIGNVSSLHGKIDLQGNNQITGSIAVDPNNLKYPNWYNHSGKNLSNQLSEKMDLDLQDYLPKFPNELFNNPTTLSSYPNTKDGLISNNNFNGSWNISGGNFTVKLDKSYQFNTFTMPGNTTVTFDVGDKDIDLYIDYLDMSFVNINIIGSGKLNLHVNSMKNHTIGGNINAQGNPESLNFYYNGTTPLSLGADLKYSGSLFSNSADLSLNITNYKGNIYSGGKNVKILGSSPYAGQYIIAPNAHVQALAGAKLKGTVVADSLTATGDASITYGESLLPLPNINNLPSQYEAVGKFIKESTLEEL